MIGAAEWERQRIGMGEPMAPIMRTARNRGKASKLLSTVMPMPYGDVALTVNIYSGRRECQTIADRTMVQPSVQPSGRVPPEDESVPFRRAKRPQFGQPRLNQVSVLVGYSFNT